MLVSFDFRGGRKAAESNDAESAFKLLKPAGSWLEYYIHQ
jgi:hypothetical protein